MTDSLKARQRVSRLRLALGAVALLAIVAGAIILWTWQAGRLDVLDMSTALIVCIVVGVAAAGLALTYTPGPIPDTGSMTGRDHAQKNRLWSFAGTTVAGLFWTGKGTSEAIQAFGENDPVGGYIYAGLVLLLLAIAPAALMGWGGSPVATEPDDELSRSFRARATATGFWTLLVGGAAAFLISLSNPTVLPSLLPFALWLGGAVACAHFVWLHHRAEQDLDDDG